MKIRRTVNIALYGCKVMFIFEENITTSYNKLCKKYKFPVENGSCAGGMITGDMNLYHVLLGVKNLSHNTIAHEISHLSKHLLEDRAINDEESGAWLTGYLTEILYKITAKNKIQVS